MQSLTRRQLVFSVGMLVFGLAEAGIAFGVVGQAGLEEVLYSVTLCVIPGWLTIYAGDLMKQRNLSPYIVLVGTALRMIFVLLGIFAISVIRPMLPVREFAVWLVTSYLAALALETWLVLIPTAPKAAG